MKKLLVLLTVLFAFSFCYAQGTSSKAKDANSPKATCPKESNKNGEKHAKKHAKNGKKHVEDSNKPM